MKKNKNLDLIIILGVVTVIALVTAVMLAVRPFEVKKFEKLDTVTINDYTKQSKKTESYFVLVYDSENDRYEQVVECVLEYNEYARTHKDELKIYIMDYQENKKITSSAHLSIEDSKISTSVPCLFTVNGQGSISNKKTTISDICNYLEDIMQGKQ